MGASGIRLCAVPSANEASGREGSTIRAAVQEVQPDSKPFRHIRRNASRLACLKKRFEGAMAKAFDHQLRL